MSPPRCRLTALAAIALSAVTGQAIAQTHGPDIIVGDLPDVATSGVSPVTINGVAYKPFAVGTTSCNKGDVPVLWFTGGTDNRHPAISQNLYRYSPTTGRFEQLGQGSLKHGFTALQGTTCSSYFGFGCSATGGTTLGVGCSDPYGSGLNNNPGGMGPKWQVNAATGVFPYPPAIAASSGPIRVRMSDLNASTTGSRYFIEGQYIVGDDAAAGNKNNNASWREVNVIPVGTPPTATDFTMSLSSGSGGVIHREQAGIYAWQSVDPSVTIATYDVPNDGRFILGVRVTGPVGGLYTYEYALHNLNSQRCAGSLVIPLPGTQNALSAVGFHDVEAVAEPNALANPANPASDDWAVSGAGAGSTAVSWSGPSYAGTLPVYTMDVSVPYKVASFSTGTGNDHSANVIRWGAMFNFRFMSELAPGSGGQIAVGLWRPGTGTSFVMNNIPTPGGSTVGALTAACCTGTACTVATQTDCGTGAWGLPGSNCSPNPCLIGACCMPDLSCTQFNTANCSAQAGSYQGDGSTCASNPCPTGACCSNTTGACTIGGSSCPSGSTYMGLHTACGTTSCPTGACCNNSTAGCAAGGTACPAGSTYMGPGSACASVTCTVTEYCTAGSDSCGVQFNDERISEVIIGTIDNVSGAGDGPAGCYSDFRAISATLIPGQVYPVTIRNAGVYSGDQAAVWVDWNRNLGFVDSGEQFTLATSGSAATFVGNVTVPAGASPGPTRMRVRVTWTGSLTPCGVTTYGEVEDYTINVAPAGTCCVGATCNTSVTQANCTAPASSHAGALFVPRASGGTACNTQGNFSSPCCEANYNKVGGISVQDLFDFLADWFSGNPLARVGGDGTGPAPGVQSLFDFLAAWFGGGC